MTIDNQGTSYPLARGTECSSIDSDLRNEFLDPTFVFNVFFVRVIERFQNIKSCKQTSRIIPPYAAIIELKNALQLSNET